MNKLIYNLIKIKFINKKAFINLSSEKQDIVIDKYHLIRKNLPFFRKLSRKTNSIIKDGLIDIVNNDSDNFLSRLYIKFVENLVVRINNREYKYIKNNYYHSFALTKEEDYYRTLFTFVDYIDKLMKKKNKDKRIMQEYSSLEDSRIIYLYEIYNYFNKRISEVNIFYQIYYRNILKYLFVAHLIDNELIYNLESYQNMCNYLIENKNSILDHYYLNYRENYISIVKDLFERINDSKDKKIIH